MIELTPEICSFLSQHADDDPTRLLLSASRYPHIDMRWAVEQIEARRQLRNKLPEWFAASSRLIMGGRIPAEQCSSEQTAQYKRSLVLGDSLCDLTGGMGVDCYYMSRGLQKAYYTERQPHLCEAARHNFPELGALNIEVREGDALQLGIPVVDTLYLDPARRAQDGKRVYDLTDCEPNVVELRPTLLKHCKRLIIKISPMADIARVIEQMPGLREVHVVAVKNECKELLLVLDGDLSTEESSPTEGPMIYCIDFRTQDVVKFEFRWGEESNTHTEGSPKDDTTPNYLYEPDVTLLKAGAFRLPCQRWGVQQFDANSHLYHSDRLVPDFPGRIFKIEETMKFSSKLLKGLKACLPQANIATRNFPLTADALRHKTGLKDGGGNYLFGTTQTGVGPLLLLCRKALTIICILVFLLPSSVYGRRTKSRPVTETVESLLQGVQLDSPCLWNQGLEFVYQEHQLNAALHPRVPDMAYDTLDFYQTRWTFDGLMSEENWMGQQEMHLQFRSPQGRIYRYSTGRLMSQASDTTYHPALPSLCALQPVADCDARLRDKSLYLLINDERLLTPDSPIFYAQKKGFRLRLLRPTALRACRVLPSGSAVWRFVCGHR